MNVIDNELFKVRKGIDTDYEVLEIGNRKSKILIVHDLFEYPDDVYDFIQKHPIELNTTYDPDANYDGPMGVNYTPGFIGSITMEARPLRRFVNWGINNIFNDPVYYRNIHNRINAFQSGVVGNKRANYPHSDESTDYSATIYMDKKNLGGTGFYRFRDELELYPEHGRYLPKAKEWWDWNDDWRLLGKAEVDTIDNDENWTMYYVSPMEWNKAVIYEAHLFHNAIIKPGMYTGNEFRTSINIFATRT